MRLYLGRVLVLEKSDVQPHFSQDQRDETLGIAAGLALTKSGAISSAALPHFREIFGVFLD